MIIHIQLSGNYGNKPLRLLATFEKHKGKKLTLSASLMEQETTGSY